jgi:hypothetical protein
MENIILQFGTLIRKSKFVVNRRGNLQLSQHGIKTFPFVIGETWQLWYDDKEVSKAGGFMLGKEHSFLLKYTSLARILPVELPKEDGGR